MERRHQAKESRQRGREMPKRAMIVGGFGNWVSLEMYPNAYGKWECTFQRINSGIKGIRSEN